MRRQSASGRQRARGSKPAPSTPSCIGQETRARLEEAAVTLVLRDGLEQTTIGTISELADVSPRTFFNYFDSKDSAILGLRPPRDYR